MSAIDSNLGFNFRSTADPTPPPATGFGAMSSEDFFEIIFQELGNQDPLAPNDTQALIDQMAMIRQIESDSQISTSLEGMVGSNAELVDELASITNAMVQQSQISSAGSLVGKVAKGEYVKETRVSTENGVEVRKENEEVSGFINAVVFKEDGPYAKIDDGFDIVDVPLENLREVIDPALVQVAGDQPEAQQPSYTAQEGPSKPEPKYDTNNTP